MDRNAPRPPTVLFVCVHNPGRSQMAAGWLRHLAGGSVEVRPIRDEIRTRVERLLAEIAA